MPKDNNKNKNKNKNKDKNKNKPKNDDISSYFVRKDKVENTTSDTTGKDITKEVEEDIGKVEMYSVDELAPISIPITIPYLEIYRTNELEYIPYKSPYNVGIQSSSSSEDSSSSSTDSEGLGNTSGASSDSNLTSDMNSAVGADKSDDDANTQSSFGDRYSNYGRGDYRGYDDYGRRERDSRGRYRGHEHLDRMYDHYGRYMGNRERYGAGDTETDKSFHYMVEALEDFIMVLKEEAESPQQKQQLMESLQNSMR